jgi:hypothetical protein
VHGHLCKKKFANFHVPPQFAGEKEAMGKYCGTCGKAVSKEQWHTCHNCKGAVHGGFGGCSEMVEESGENGAGHTPYFCKRKACVIAAAAAKKKKKSAKKS